MTEGEPLSQNTEELDLLHALAIAAQEKKASHVVLLEMNDLVQYTDYFLLCSASNRRQVLAIADTVLETAKKLGIETRGAEGRESGRWVLVDLNIVVVHIFDETYRGFYNLDGLWSDAPRLEVPTPAPAEADPLFTLPS